MASYYSSSSSSSSSEGHDRERWPRFRSTNQTELHEGVTNSVDSDPVVGKSGLARFRGRWWCHVRETRNTRRQQRLLQRVGAFNLRSALCRRGNTVQFNKSSEAVSSSTCTQLRSAVCLKEMGINDASGMTCMAYFLLLFRVVARGQNRGQEARTTYIWITIPVRHPKFKVTNRQ